jgi:hypothetical protein
MSKIAIFAFNGNTMCFMHVLLNALDMQKRGIDVKVIIEGEATKIIKDLEEIQNKIYLDVKNAGLIDCICKACSSKMGVLDYVSEIGIPISDEMTGHPAMGRYIEHGYEIITM